MKFVFRSIKSIELHEKSWGGDVPPATDADIQWAKEVKKRLHKDLIYQFDVPDLARRLIAEGNLRRFAWLAEGHIYLHLWLSKWNVSPVLGEIMKVTPYKSEWAADIMECHKPLIRPQRDILSYLIHSGRGTDYFNEAKLIQTAIKTGQNDLLPELDTALQFGHDAVECGNADALSYLLNRHFKNRDKDEGGINYKELFVRFYRHAARLGQVNILDILRDTASLSSEYRTCFQIAIESQETDAAEWFLKNGLNKAEAFSDCIRLEAFDLADKLIQDYDVDPNIDYCAALRSCLENRCFSGVEYLTRKNADMTKMAEYIQNKEITKRNGFDKQLCELFERATIREQMISWVKQNNTTIMRQHLTSNYAHTTIFFFAEQRIAQYITDIETNRRMNDKVWKFDDFNNRMLLQEAAEQIKRLEGDPCYHNDNHKPLSGPEFIRKRK
jgi:hypothetical protein